MKATHPVKHTYVICRNEGIFLSKRRAKNFAFIRLRNEIPGPKHKVIKVWEI